MTFLPGTAITIDGKAFVVQYKHTPSCFYPEIYTVKAPKTRRVHLCKDAAGAWRYGQTAKYVSVRWTACDGCGRALLVDERERCDDCRKVDAAIADGAL